MTERAMGIAELKRRFSDALASVRFRGDRVVIERRGTPVAALVPLEDLDRLRGAEAGGFLALVGAFDDVEDLAETLDDLVRSRSGQPPRPAPSLPA